MAQTSRPGSIRLFETAGISVFLHWSWFVVAAIEIGTRTKNYSSPIWNVLEYLALFGMVLLHEFGHALACRQVGGKADQIMLWPLGGVAIVQPPPRPRAVLWSIAAGPLVNVALVPVLLGIGYVCKAAGVWEAMPDAHAFLRALYFINLVLLVFNLLPVYPLDGGQILRALLWFPFGRATSLKVTSLFSLVASAGLLVVAAVSRMMWLSIIAVFMLLRCWGGLREAQALGRIAAAPRDDRFACPTCGVPAPHGDFWACGKCRTQFDTFHTHAVCPKCDTRFESTRCVDCGATNPIAAWATSIAAPLQRG